MMMILMIGTNNELRCSFSSRETSFREFSEFPVKAGCISRADKSVTNGSLFIHVATIVRDDRPWSSWTLQGSSPHLS